MIGQQPHTHESVILDTGYKVKEPLKVVAAGFIFDADKFEILPQMWKRAEAHMIKQMPTLKPEELFHQCDICPPGKTPWHSFRYYTPKDNILERVR